MQVAFANDRQAALTNFTRWTFNPTGDYAADCATGRRLAREYLEWRHEPEFAPLLGWIMGSIAKLQRNHSGIEAGFFAVVSNALSGCEIPHPKPSLVVIDGGKL